MNRLSEWFNHSLKVPEFRNIFLNKSLTQPELLFQDILSIQTIYRHICQIIERLNNIVFVHWCKKKSLFYSVLLQFGTKRRASFTPSVQQMLSEVKMKDFHKLISWEKICRGHLCHINNCICTSESVQLHLMITTGDLSQKAMFVHSSKHIKVPND